ncbi:MAG: L,D-transpeptidase [Candidatus Villigracilaceae bacterium]
MNSDSSPAKPIIRPADQALLRGDRRAAQAVAPAANLKETRRRSGIKKEAPHRTVMWATILLLTLAGVAIWSNVSSDQGMPALISSGMNNATAIGTFSVLSKIPNAYGSTWNIWMPYWLVIYWSGGLENGIHALPILPGGSRLWSGYLGTPISYGCVVLGEYEARLLYEWAEIGTPVVIQW